MGKQDDFLVKLATITDTIDKLSFGSKKVSISITLDKETYDGLYNMFSMVTDKKMETFSIIIDEYEIVIKRAV